MLKNAQNQTSKQNERGRQCLGVRLLSPFGDMCQTRHCDYGSSNEHPFALHDSTHGLQCIFRALNSSSIDMRRFQVKHTCTHHIILIFLRFVSYRLKAFVVLTRALKEFLLFCCKKIHCTFVYALHWMPRYTYAIRMSCEKVNATLNDRILKALRLRECVYLGSGASKRRKHKCL